jgi:CBS domain containing-hemolysin-like protein
MKLRRRAAHPRHVGSKLGQRGSGEVSEQELQIRSGIESMRTATAREVMTPRVDIVALAVPVTMDDVARAVRRSGHSHFPVYEEDLDNLLGVLFVKDLFRPGVLGVAALPSEGEAAELNGDASSPVLDVSRLVREPYIVPESHPALESLAEMRKGRRSFAVVVDEYGGVAGVLTINGLVSELVGDLHDEFDRSHSPAIERVDQSRFLVDGACGVDELRSDLQISVPDGDYVTLGGFLLDLFGKIPTEGSQVEFEGWSFRVTEMDRRRVAKVVVQAPAATMNEQAGAER